MRFIFSSTLIFTFFLGTVLVSLFILFFSCSSKFTIFIYWFYFLFLYNVRKYVMGKLSVRPSSWFIFLTNYKTDIIQGVLKSSYTLRGFWNRKDKNSLFQIAKTVQDSRKSINSYQMELKTKACKTHNHLCWHFVVLHPRKWTKNLSIVCERKCQSRSRVGCEPRATGCLQGIVFSPVKKKRNPCDRSSDSKTYKRVRSSANQKYEPPYPVVYVSVADLLRAHKRSIQPYWDNKLSVV